MRALDALPETHQSKPVIAPRVSLRLLLDIQPVTPTHPHARFSGEGRVDCQPSDIRDSMMLSKSHLFAPVSASVLVAAGFITTLAILCPTTSFAQTSPMRNTERRLLEVKPGDLPTKPAGSSSSTQSISTRSAEAKNLPKAPSFMTRRERLRAKPLDPRATSGKPIRLTKAELKAELKELKNAKRGNSTGGAPNRNAKKVAQEQYPNDWK